MAWRVLQCGQKFTDEEQGRVRGLVTGPALDLARLQMWTYKTLLELDPA